MLRRGAWLPFLLGWTLLGWTSAARAQQVVLVDETYTATTANTMDSHYWLPPSAETPDDWRAPIDYASGKVHARLEVIDKPSAEGTLYNICFEAPSNYACMPYSPEYTTVGVYDFEYPFSAFYQYDLVDWTEPIDQVAFVLKDHDEIKVQGDSAFYPTTIHITLVLVPPGETYVEPSEPMDAGVSSDAGAMVDGGAGGEDPLPIDDAGTPAESVAPPAVTPTPASGGSSGASSGGAPAPGAAPSGGPGAANAGTGGAPAATPGATIRSMPPWHRSSGTSCAVGMARSPGPGALVLFALGASVARMRRRRHVDRARV